MLYVMQYNTHLKCMYACINVIFVYVCMYTLMRVLVRLGLDTLVG